MDSILALPDEIILEILCKLPPREIIRATAVCRCFRDVLRPYIIQYTIVQSIPYEMCKFQCIYSDSTLWKSYSVFALVVIKENGEIKHRLCTAPHNAFYDEYALTIYRDVTFDEDAPCVRPNKISYASHYKESWFCGEIWAVSDDWSISIKRRRYETYEKGSDPKRLDFRVFCPPNR